MSFVRLYSGNLSCRCFVECVNNLFPGTGTADEIAKTKVMSASPDYDRLTNNTLSEDEISTDVPEGESIAGTLVY